MGVVRNVRCDGSHSLGSWPAASRINFGAVVVPSGLTAGVETIKMATAETDVLGIADRRMFMPKGKYDGFYETYDGIDVVSRIGFALVIPNGENVNIDFGDYLEVAVLADTSTNPHGILEEAGTRAGTTYTTSVVARALHAVTMGSKSYKIPASDVASGDTTITMTSGEPSTMGISKGDYILLEDITGELQVNMVASVAAAEIGLVVPSTVVLENSASDLVTRLYPCKVQIGK